MKLSWLLDDYNLPASTMRELGAKLFDISKLEKHGVVTRTQQRGKNLTSITVIRKQMASLAKHCMILQPTSPTPTNESTIIANESDENSSQATKTDTLVSSKNNDTTEIPIDTNLDSLIDQVLTLHREFRPIRLSHDSTIRTEEGGQSKAKCKKPLMDVIKVYLNITKNKINHVCQRSMYNVLNLITLTDQTSLYTIDYVTSLLVNETTEVLQDIIEKMLDTNLAR